VIKSSDTKDHSKNEDFFSEMMQQFCETLESITECNNNNVIDSLRGLDTVQFCAPPLSWTSSESKVSGDVYHHTEETLTCLSTCIHTSLDACPPPSTCILSILWLCDSPPTNPFPAIFGALQRATTWHGARVFIITREQETNLPDWLSVATLRVEIMPQSYLCDCHHIQEFLSPTLVWQGALAFSNNENELIKLPGFELHMDHDQLDTVLNKFSPIESGKSRSTTRYFSPHVEVVSPVSVASVLAKPQFLTPHRLELKTPLRDNEDLPSKFMSSCQDNSGYILKLKYSFDKPQFDPNLLKTDNWKQSVINCNFRLESPCASIGNDVQSINILVFDGSVEDKDCSRATSSKAAIILKSPNDLQNLHTMKQSLSRADAHETTPEDVDSVMSGLRQISINTEKLTKLKCYIRDVQSKVLELLKENNSELLINHTVTEILIAVQEEILNNCENIVTDEGQVDKREIDTLFNDKVDHEKNLDNATENWQEIRFLKYLSWHADKEEQEKDAQSKLMKPSDEEFVVLEAKELIKYFDKNGLARRDLEEVDVKVRNCPLRPQISNKDYESLISKTFDKIPDTDFSLKGFRFKEEQDFSSIEFTQYHDVYYNTGTVAESYDLKCKNYRDCMVGPHRETKSTFCSGDAASTRMKVTIRKPSDNIERKDKAPTRERRVSPRKKAAGPLQNMTNRRSVHESLGSRKSLQVPQRRSSQERPDSKLNLSKGSDKGSERRKSGTETAPSGPGELSDINKRKLRIAVYEALHKQKIDEKNPLFKKCFPKLFNICKMYVLEACEENSGSVKKWMSEIADMQVMGVVAMEKMLMKRKL